MTEVFRAAIKDGKLSFGPILLKRFHEFLGAKEGKALVISLDKPSRLQSQNAFYWVYLDLIARETGDNADDLHEFFKRKLLPPRFVQVRGEELRLPATTTDLDKVQFTEYLDEIC